MRTVIGLLSYLCSTIIVLEKDHGEGAQNYFIHTNSVHVCVIIFTRFAVEVVKFHDVQKVCVWDPQKCFSYLFVWLKLMEWWFLCLLPKCQIVNSMRKVNIFMSLSYNITKITVTTIIEELLNNIWVSMTGEVEISRHSINFKPSSHPTSFIGIKIVLYPSFLLLAILSFSVYIATR